MDNIDKKEDDETKKNLPSFYAVIPAFVRYNKNLNPNAKLLYGEITCLSDKKGYCYASNNYFAKVYDVGRSSISNWIKNLVEEGFIRQEFIYAADKPVITERRLYLVFPENKPDQAEKINKLQNNEGGQNFDHGVVNSVNRGGQIIDQGVVNSMDRGGQIIDQGGGQNFDHGVVNSMDRGGQFFGEIIIQANNTRSSSSDFLEEEDSKQEFKDIGDSNKYPENINPPIAENSERDDEVLSLKQNLKQLNPSLIFDNVFYSEALDFISANSLDSEYIIWIYDFCIKHKPLNLDGYFYKVFFDPRLVELYRESPKPPQLKTLRCPVCGKEHNAEDSFCPQCHLSVYDLNDPAKIEQQKQIYFMAPDDKKAYESEFDKLLEETPFEDFEGRKKKISALKQKYRIR